MTRLNTSMFQIARRFSRIGDGRLFGWIFEHTINWLPLQRLHASERLLVISHPRPSYPFHALLIPRQAIAGLQELQAHHNSLLVEILQSAAGLAEEYGLKKYQIIVNGGAFQDVPQLHFHMISDENPGTRVNTDQGRFLKLS